MYAKLRTSLSVAALMALRAVASRQSIAITGFSFAFDSGRQRTRKVTHNFDERLLWINSSGIASNKFQI